MSRADGAAARADLSDRDAGAEQASGGRTGRTRPPARVRTGVPPARTVSGRPATAGPAPARSAGTASSDPRLRNPRTAGSRTPDHRSADYPARDYRASDYAAPDYPAADDQALDDQAAGWPAPAGATAVGADRREHPVRRPMAAPRPGVRLNGIWCAVLLGIGDLAALVVAGLIGWSPGVPVAVLLAVVAVGVALLAGRGGLFEAAILPGTVAVIVCSIVVAIDPSAAGGLAVGGGTFRRVWEAIGLVAPAAATAWVAAIVTIALRRAGLLRRL